MSFQSNLNDPVPPSPSAERMKNTFDEARRKAESRDLKSGDDWQRLRLIEEQAERARQTNERQYREQYEARVNRETKRLLDEKFRNDPHYRPDNAQDGSSITRQAEKNVRNNHARRINTINKAQESETDHLRQIMRTEASFERPTTGRERASIARDFQRSR